MARKMRQQKWAPRWVPPECSKPDVAHRFEYTTGGLLCVYCRLYPHEASRKPMK